jgi:hypothetical protein
MRVPTTDANTAVGVCMATRHEVASVGPVTAVFGSNDEQAVSLAAAICTDNRHAQAAARPTLSNVRRDAGIAGNVSRGGRVSFATQLSPVRLRRQTS